MRAVVIAASLVLAACGQSAPETPTSVPPTEAPASADAAPASDTSAVAALRAADFAAYPAEAFTGERRMPDFNGAAREYRAYRTLLSDGAAQGPNFAGRFALVQIGCGAGCNAIYQIDLATGGVTEITFAPSVIEIDNRADSALLKARWFIAPREVNGAWMCHYENFVWRDAQLNSLGQAEADGGCGDDWPPQ